MFEGVLRLDDLHFADTSLADPLGCLDERGVKRKPHSLHKEDVFLLCKIAQRLKLLFVDCDGLFAQNVFARLQTQFCVLIVHRGRGSDIYDIDVGIAHQLLVAAVRFLKAELFGESLRFFKTSGADGVGNSVGMLGEAFCEFMCDATGGQDRPVDFFAHNGNLLNRELCYNMVEKW